jgi:hypothetical protein
LPHLDRAGRNGNRAIGVNVNERPRWFIGVFVKEMPKANRLNGNAFFINLLFLLNSSISA